MSDLLLVSNIITGTEQKGEKKTTFNETPLHMTLYKPHIVPSSEQPFEIVISSFCQ